MEYALITGASMGLGSALANELTRRGFNLILVSLPNENIDKVVDNCRCMGVLCYTYEFDLTNRESLINLTREINQRYNISVLINNVGIGGSQRFLDSSLSYIESIMRLNIEIITILTHQLLTNLKRQKQSHILNISSMVSCTPVGYKTVYPASKEYIRHFSRGLHEELKADNISVTVALLGPMPTSDDIKRRIKAQCTIGKLLTISTQKAAKVSVDAIMRGKSEVVVGFINKLSLKLLKIISMYICTKIATKTVKRELR